MLIIDDDQMEELKRIATKDFERRIIRYLKDFFPQKMEHANEEQARAFIGHAVKRAKEYGIVRERDIARYVVLSVLFGARFDSEERYQWARSILARVDLEAESKLESLFEATVRRRDSGGQARGRPQ